MKYLKLRQKTQDQLSKEQLDYEVEDNKLQLEADLRETQRALSLAKQNLLALKSQKMLSSVAILKEMDNIRGYEEGIKSLEELVKELF